MKIWCDRPGCWKTSPRTARISLTWTHSENIGSESWAIAMRLSQRPPNYVQRPFAIFFQCSYSFTNINRNVQKHNWEHQLCKTVKLPLIIHLHQELKQLFDVHRQCTRPEVPCWACHSVINHSVVVRWLKNCQVWHEPQAPTHSLYHSVVAASVFLALLLYW